jgi:hypothetical protein
LSHRLQFETLHHYPSHASGILVPVRLDVGQRRIDLLASLDTGAAFCIFQREYGEELGIRIEAGLRQRVATAAGSFWTFGHPVTLDVLGLRLETIVYFAALPNFPRNVLGRRGWLDRVRMALIDYDQRLYLSPYDG